MEVEKYIEYSTKLEEWKMRRLDEENVRWEKKNIFNLISIKKNKIKSFI